GFVSNGGEMSYKEFMESMPREKLEKLLTKGVYQLEQHLKPTIDEQIIHFWHLQLQFLYMDEYYLADIHSMILYNQGRSTPLHRNHEDIATELALHLSGLA